MGDLVHVTFPTPRLRSQRYFCAIEETLSNLESERSTTKLALDRNAVERKRLQGELRGIEEDIHVVIRERIRELVRVEEEAGHG